MSASTSRYHLRVGWLSLAACLLVSFPLQAQTVFTSPEEMLKGISTQVQQREKQQQSAAAAPAELPVALPVDLPPISKPDPKLERIKNGFLAEMLYQKEDSWFSQYLGSGLPVPIEMKGLKIEGPYPVPLSEAEKQTGIESKVRFLFKNGSFRHFTKRDGWGKWQYGNPIYLTDFFMVKKDGIWQVTESPAKSYSLLKGG